MPKFSNSFSIAKSSPGSPKRNSSFLLDTTIRPSLMLSRRRLTFVRWKPEAEGVPGINIDREQMVRTWHKLLPLMSSAPFADNPGSGLRYGFVNPAYSWGDASVLHAMLRLNGPKKLIDRKSTRLNSSH